MTSKLIYKGDLHCEATHERSGSKIVTDAPPDNNGKGEAFSPTDLVATSLGACILTVMGIKARDKGINMEGATCDVTKVMKENPRRIGRIELMINMPSNDFTDKEKALLEKLTHHCPVSRSLHPDLEEFITLNW